MKRKVAAVVLAACAVLTFASAASTQHWRLIGLGWWVDTATINVVKQDDGSVMTLFGMALSHEDGVPPNDSQQTITGTVDAIDCATGALYYNRRDDWKKDENKWPPEWRASLKRIVCK